MNKGLKVLWLFRTVFILMLSFTLYLVNENGMDLFLGLAMFVCMFFSAGLWSGHIKKLFKEMNF
jgi:hypothetical protein